MKRFTRNSGQALVAATVGLVALIGATGLAVDMGYLRYQKRLQQSAADSAALAGAAEASYGQAGPAAFEDSSLNGFTNGASNVTITVNQPPATGPYTADAGAVEVLITAIHPTFFMKIFGINNATLTARAVASAAGRNCVYALAGGLGITNSGTFNGPFCGILDDGDLNNSGTIIAASVGVHGAASGAATIPGAITGIIQAADPLAFMPLPTAPGGCAAATLVGNPATLNPGNYCTGISVTTAQNVIFNPGIYEVTAGGINFNGTGTITGNGVTFSLSPTGGGVSINTAPGATQQLNLTAPTVGADAGILFYQDPLNLAPASIQGNGNPTLQGVLYFPGTTLTLNNTGTGAAYTVIVGKTLNLSGTLNFPSNYTSLPNGSPIKQAVLVE
jgi:Flp pilus assembly protein TadG